MKKLTVLVYQKNLSQALCELRKTGLVHIKHIQKPHAGGIDSLENKINLLDQAASLMDALVDQRKDVPVIVLTSVVKEVIGFNQQTQQCLGRLKELEERLELVKKLGHASVNDLDKLKGVGAFVKLYRCNSRALKRIPKDKMIQIIFRKGREVYIAFIGTKDDDCLDFLEVGIPQESQQSLERKIHGLKRDLGSVEKQLREFSTYRSCLKIYRKELLKRLELGHVRFGAGFKEGIYYLQGFCPKQSVEAVELAAAKNGWAVMVQEPEDPQEVPTLIKNPRWIGIVKPIFKFMGTVPGYDEFDISFWFLLSFSLFFAMLIGDAGYGFLFLTVSFFLSRKFRSLPREPFVLAYVLSAATIVWGAVTGTWFGVEKIGQLPGFNYLVINRINSFVGSNHNFMMYLCLFIGVGHLSIAHLKRAFAFINSLKALAQVGWIFILWAIFFLAGTYILNKPFPASGPLLLTVGLGLVILFSNPQKNFFKGVLVSLADLPLSIISSFSDIVSYLRLFAVGYATVVVASSFNNMALSGGINNPLAALAAAIILVLGHSLNILLGFMAVIVHGVRLNMLEFSGHLGMQWSGKEYKPFRE
ncbi:MAG: hypothetical protein K9L86_05965 [Candidatus Omnitrophica bacterium]|nr:hypothetical protein [Candidatus Omnitrophota bacterium]